jgi:hypothetical protein
MEQMDERSAPATAAEGVSYFAMPGVEGQWFRCGPFRATLSTTACARRWREAQTAVKVEAERLERCRVCLLGSVHAGERGGFRSPLFHAEICPRCGRGGTRIVKNRLCISCTNRTYEFVKNKNGKGTPVTFRLEPRRIGVIVHYGGPNARLMEVMEPHSTDTEEVVAQTLRTMEGRIAFTRVITRPRVTAEADP